MHPSLAAMMKGSKVEEMIAIQVKNFTDTSSFDNCIVRPPRSVYS